MPIIVTSGGTAAQTIIDRAMRLIGELEPGQSTPALESIDVLVALNALVGSWRLERLMCWATQDESVPLVSGNTSRSLGPSGDFVTNRPDDVISAYVVYGSSSIPVDVISSAKWDAIAVKTSTSDTPYKLYYEPQVPNGVAYLWPVPTASSTLHLRTKTPFTGFTSVTDAPSLPPGWDQALATNLAVSIAPENETEAKASVVMAARLSKAAIKLVNSRPIEAVTDLALLFRSRRSNIFTDQ